MKQCLQSCATYYLAIWWHRSLCLQVPENIESTLLPKWASLHGIATLLKILNWLNCRCFNFCSFHWCTLHWVWSKRIAAEMCPCNFFSAGRELGETTCRCTWETPPYRSALARRSIMSQLSQAYVQVLVISQGGLLSHKRFVGGRTMSLAIQFGNSDINHAAP